jgi:hypothetical protein
VVSVPNAAKTLTPTADLDRLAEVLANKGLRMVIACAVV